MEELPIIQKTYDLIKWYVPILNRLPKLHKFALGDRMINGLYDLLEGLLIARYNKEKLKQLESLKSKLDILRYQTRLLFEFSLANRVSFGTHKALHRFTQFARNSRYILQCDIQKYFPSIDHEILKSILRRKIKCRDTLWLIDTIIDNSNEQLPVVEYFRGDDLLTPLQRRRGLPVGNLTSQIFANVYLNGFDHFVKEKLHVQKYLRYVDDFSLFSDDWNFLFDSRIAIEEYLATKLRLKIHPIKSQLFETKQGANYVGFRILPSCIRVRTENLRRARRRLKFMQRKCNQGKINQDKVSQSIQSWFAHLEHGDTWRLRQQIFTSLTWVRE